MKRIIKNIGISIVVIIFVAFNLNLINHLPSMKKDNTELKPKIIIISHVLTNPYWNYVRLGAEKAAAERNAVVEFQGPDYANAEEGIKLINMAYSARASGIITYVQDQYKYNEVINKVMSGGIPVVTIDSDAERSGRLAYVGTDNIAAGRIGAEELIRQVGTTGKIAIIIGGKDVKNQIERVSGFKDYILKNSRLEISEIESSDSYLLEAEKAANRILVNNKDIKALFCTSALDGLGAEKAISSLQLSSKVKIICFDDLPETLDKIKEGLINATIVQKPYYMGYKAVQIIMDKIEGKFTGNRKLFLTDVEVVNQSNVKEYMKKQGEKAN